MSRYVDTKSLADATEGSFERVWSEVREALPEDATLVATFEDRVVYEKSGQFFSAGWEKHDNGITLKESIDAGVSTFGEERLGVVTGRSVLEAVDAIWSGGGADLLTLSSFVRPGQRYFATDFVELAEGVLGDREWSNFYAENRKMVRKACHGRLGILEGQVPTRRFAKLKDLSSYGAQINEAVETICSLASEVAETLKSMGDLEFKSDLVSDALEIREALSGLSESASAVHMWEFVSLIDRSCDRLRDLLVMAEYISIDREN